MKRFVMLIIACGLFVVFATGCSDVAEGRMESMENGNTVLSYSVQAAETAALIEEGYYVVEGILSEINKEGFFWKQGMDKPCILSWLRKQLFVQARIRKFCQGRILK